MLKVQPISEPVTFPPTLQNVGSAIGIAIGWGLARYYWPKRKWISLFCVLTGFMVGTMIAAILLFTFGMYEPEVR